MMQRLVDDQGQPLRLYSFVPEDERFLAFVSQCLRWPPQVIARRWRRNLTTGEGTTPYFVDTESQMEEKVSKQAGGLGYLLAEQLSGDANYRVIYQCKE
ncbi:MAG TPA: hypothetical protein EYP05_04240 [Piscirickettsiaceae bacterium]|nr:hypothetical protein [Piscirickettsiaceae bacterium]HIQ40134.1 hypothetical protein [Sulfurivirga caldicuralii]